jgi:hypothetical protein
VGYRRAAYRVLVGKPDKKRQPGRPGRGRGMVLKFFLKESFEGLDQD